MITSPTEHVTLIFLKRINTLLLLVKHRRFGGVFCLGGFLMLAGFCLAIPYGVQYSAACVLFITEMATGCILAITKKKHRKRANKFLYKIC